MPETNPTPRVPKALDQAICRIIGRAEAEAKRASANGDDFNFDDTLEYGRTVVRSALTAAPGDAEDAARWPKVIAHGHITVNEDGQYMIVVPFDELDIPLWEEIERQVDFDGSYRKAEGFNQVIDALMTPDQFADAVRGRKA